MATYLNASVTAVSAKHSGGVPKSCSKHQRHHRQRRGAAAQRWPVRQPVHPEPGRWRHVLAGSHGAGQFLQRGGIRDDRIHGPDVRQRAAGDQQRHLGSNLYQSSWATGTPLAVTAALDGGTGDQRVRPGYRVEVPDLVDHDVPDQAAAHQWQRSADRAVHVQVRHQGRGVRELLRRGVRSRRVVAADHHRYRLLAAARPGCRPATVLGSAERRLRYEQRLRLG